MSDPLNRSSQAAPVKLKPAIFVWLTVFFLCAYLLTMKGYPLFADEEIIYTTAVNLLEYGSPDTVFHPWITKPGRDGLNYSNYGIGASLFEIPFYAAGRMFLPEQSSNLKILMQIPAVFVAPVIGALSALCFFYLALTLGFSYRKSWILTLIFGFGTMMWPYSKMLFRDPLQTLLLMGAVTFLIRARQTGRQAPAWIAGCCMGFALTVKETLILYLPFMALYLLWHRSPGKLRPALSFGLPVLIGGLGCLAYNYLRFGNFMDFGYTASNIRFGLSAPMIEGLYGLLISSGQGLFITSPVLILGLFGFPLFFRSHRRESLLILSIIVTAILFHSKYWSWGGGWAWGPRYLLIIIPYLVLPIGTIWNEWMRHTFRKCWISLLLILSIAVQIPAVTMHLSPYLSLVLHDVHLFPQLHSKESDLRNDLLHVDFVPQFSPVWGLTWTLKHALAMPFKDRDDIREAMKADCPWRNLSESWVPEYPDKALGMGPDLFPVMVKQTFPDKFAWIAGLYMFIALAGVFSFYRLRNSLSQSDRNPE